VSAPPRKRACCVAWAFLTRSTLAMGCSWSPGMPRGRRSDVSRLGTSCLSSRSMLRPSDQDMAKYRKHLNRETRSGRDHTVTVVSTACGRGRSDPASIFVSTTRCSQLSHCAFPATARTGGLPVGYTCPRRQNRVAEGAVSHLLRGFPLGDVPAPRIIAAANVPVEYAVHGEVIRRRADGKKARAQ
jgi:hypothetical protein